MRTSPALHAAESDVRVRARRGLTIYFAVLVPLTVVFEALMIRGSSSAYEEAVQKSKVVPGFKPISASNLGENAFIGTVTQGTETHIGLGALKGTLVVGATLVGYDPTTDNTAKLISLTREQQHSAKVALNPHENR